MHITRKSSYLAGAALVTAAMTSACATVPARAASTGPVGATSYETLPFESQIWQDCWMCAAGLEPAQLFFSANPNSPYMNSGTMAQAKAASQALSARGIVPMGGAQRWEDTYEASFPAGTFPGEPSWIQADRQSNNFPNQPEFVAWRNFINSNQQYWDYAYDGGTMPNQAGYFRSWGGQWGHLSPLTPLNTTDCPPDMKSGCTWGDEWAYRWSLTSAKTGGYAIGLSDFTDSQPSYPNMLHDFNARIVAAFAQQYGFTSQLNGLSVPNAANWINKNAYPLWTDFLSEGYGKYYNALAQRIGAATGHKALVIDQCSLTPAWRRLAGTDQRILATKMERGSYMCTWDDQITQVGRAGPVAEPPLQELAGFVIAAAREPAMRNGANLESDDSAYWQAIASFYPSLSASDQQEVGYKLMKRTWLWSSWAHIDNRGGHVRRALAFATRDYWDVGTLTALNPLTTLIQTIYPVAPFGPALYYSVNVERAIEGTEAQQSPGGSFTPYLTWAQLQQFLDAGGGFGYYVSDVALPSISAGNHNVPSAWVVIGAGNYMPSGELAALQKIAPVVTTPQQLAALPNQPFAVTGGLTGFAFVDQRGHHMVVLSNPSTQPNAGSLSGTVTLRGLTDSNYTVQNPFTGQSQTVSTSNGVLSMPMTLTRWDTVVLDIS